MQLIAPLTVAFALLAEAWLDDWGAERAEHLVLAALLLWHAWRLCRVGKDN
ncbi:MAG: hypothetical protein JSR68_08330 [Proteobacteria bacterium]|nr:hypothetical protein [Pseudomonadota bacterium]